MWYLCDLFFILIFIFTMINHISHEYRQACSFPFFLEYVLLFLDDSGDEECE